MTPVHATKHARRTPPAGFLLFQLAFWGIPWLLARRDQAKRSTPA